MPAVGTTAVAALNTVLRRLRETAGLTDFTSLTAYQQHALDVMNSVKQEVEQAWLWDALRDTYEITTTPNVINYSFTGAGAGARILNGFNEASGGEITKRSNAFFDAQYLAGSTPASGYVTHYVENSVDASYDLKIDVYPQPNSTQVLNFNLYVPQADLTAGTNVMKVPVHVVIEGTLAVLSAERGDEMAPQQAQRYMKLLADAISHDAGRHPEETDWVVT